MSYLSKSSGSRYEGRLRVDMLRIDILEVSCLVIEGGGER